MAMDYGRWIASRLLVRMNEDIAVTFIMWRSSDTIPDISTPSPQHALTLAGEAPRL